MCWGKGSLKSQHTMADPGQVGAVEGSSQQHESSNESLVFTLNYFSFRSTIVRSLVRRLSAIKATCTQWRCSVWGCGPTAQPTAPIPPGAPLCCGTSPTFRTICEDALGSAALRCLFFSPPSSQHLGALCVCYVKEL